MGPMMHTFTGKVLDPLDLSPNDIDIQDVAHSLSNICRYGGHTKEFFSVAQHSVLISRAVPKRLARPALLHDGSETYVGDMVSPIKTRFPEYKIKVENQALIAVFSRFGLDIEDLKHIDEYDKRIALNEMKALMPGIDTTLQAIWTPLPNVKIIPWEPKAAKAFFLLRFEQLFPEEIDR